MMNIHRKYNIAKLSQVVSSVRSGLVMIIPILLIGSFTLAVKYFPVVAYQTFINNAFDGWIVKILDLIYNSTFKMVSIFLSATIAYSLASKKLRNENCISAILLSIACFFILTGLSADKPLDAYGVKGMFIAIICATVSTLLYAKFRNAIRRRVRHCIDGSDVTFNSAMGMIFPAAAIVVAFTVFELCVEKFFKVANLYELFVIGANKAFEPLGRSFFSALMFVIASSLLWFFGVHGSDVLESVMEKTFTPALNTNMELVASGKAPTEIFTKQFFDVFVLMGGCGTAICLLIAMVLFSKRRSNRRLTKTAAIPMIFNINEIMIFGLPVTLNPTLLIPFVLTPVCSLVVSFLAIKTGLVPMTISEVNWTVPVIIGGYTATGSIAGSLLQVVNIILGVFIYRPFIKAYDRKRERDTASRYNELVSTVKESESTLIPVELTGLHDNRGSLARAITEDLHVLVESDRMPLYYQTQYNDKNECIGAEALLRWNHPVYGMVYPPLVVQLARESCMLDMLEIGVLRTAVADTSEICSLSGVSIEISANVSATTILSEDYMQTLRELSTEEVVKHHQICLEITEQTALIQDDVVLERLKEIRKLGYSLAIDDFSMGHTSLAYLQNNQFDTVKIDGSLVRSVGTNPVCTDIIISIVNLSRSLGFNVLAECVETEEQMKQLMDTGCFAYQGWLFGKAEEKSTVIERLKSGTVEEVK